MATVKKLYEILHILVRSELFLIPKFRVTFKLILKINLYQYKIQRIVHMMGIAVMNLAAFADCQISGMGCEIDICNTKAAGTGAHVD